MLDDDLIVRKLGDTEPQGRRGHADYATDGLELAFKFLEKHGAPLTDDQKTVLMFATAVAHKNETDTWDHEVSARTYGSKRVAGLFKRLKAEDEE